jgi:hypothetical protein
MRRRLPEWVGITVAAVIGALMPIVIVDPYVHVPTPVLLFLMAPIAAAMTVMVWLFISSRFR